MTGATGVTGPGAGLVITGSSFEFSPIDDHSNVFVGPGHGFVSATLASAAYSVPFAGTLGSFEISYDAFDNASTDTYNVFLTINTFDQGAQSCSLVGSALGSGPCGAGTVVVNAGDTIAVHVSNSSPGPDELNLGWRITLTPLP